MKSYSLISFSCFLLLTASSLQINNDTCCIQNGKTLYKRALQKSHEKPQAVKWMETFFGQNADFSQVPSLVNLLTTVAVSYLSDCTPVILYDRAVESSDGLILEQLFRNFPLAVIHGQITERKEVVTKNLLNSMDNKCVNYILFLADVMISKQLIGEQNTNKIVVVARSSQWRTYEFLQSSEAQAFVNLLVIAQTEKSVTKGDEAPYILYTHKLYIDGLGSSAPHVLTSWFQGGLTRPHVNLFPKKMKEGFAGHRFLISVAHQPPFVIKRGQDENDDIRWEGIEIRVVKLLAEMFNFTTDFKEAKDIEFLGPGDAVAREVQSKKSNIGLGGLYVTSERIGKIDISHPHSQDCAAFISLTSTALPRWRAILGPFHWTVWLTLTIVYLLAIFPLSFSDSHSFRNLIDNPEEIENMFWYVFGTFTNCFSFMGKKSWSKSDKIATRLLIGFYWIFTVIMTACYTGSIIAFVTLPLFPETVDSVKQLLSGRYQIGTLDRGGWQYWFENSTDPLTNKLLKDIEYVPTIEQGLKNTTTAFFWAYAFLGSKAQLDYIVRTNFTTTNKRSVLHISSECFVPYGVSLAFTLNSVYKNVINHGLLRIVQSGLLVKFTHDVEWEMIRSATGKLLQASSGNSLKVLTSDDKALTLGDTQGMFLLLATGFVLGGASLLSEWLGGCFNFCRRKRPKSDTSSIISNPRSYNVPTPRQKLDSIQYSSNNLPFTISEEGDQPNQSENKGKTKKHFFKNNVNFVSFTVHAEPEPEEPLEEEKHKTEEVDEESYDIDKLFDFDYLFGEKNLEPERKSSIVSDELQLQVAKYKK